MRTVSIFLIVFLTIPAINFRFCNGDSNAVCIERETQALLSFKHGLKDPSNRLSSWTEREDCCKWAGVVCNNLTGRVVELHLRNSYDLHIGDIKTYLSTQLSGEIRPSLQELKHLNYLDLSQNDFQGIHIPKFIGSLRSLTYLNLSVAGFQGMIPPQLGNLTNLHYLDLRSQFTLPEDKLQVENLDWLLGLSSLKYLDMSMADLSKASGWLQVTNTLTSLWELRLSDCQLKEIPPLPHLNFTALSILDLSKNNFNSLMPNWIFSLNNLVSLDLGKCYFQGPIPGELHNMTSLRFLDVSHNRLNPSSMHDRLFGLSSLRFLDISNNYITSNIPDWLYNSSNLQHVDLNTNNFQGMISTAVGNMTSIVHLDLSSNHLEGAMPRSLGNLCYLRDLDLSLNKFSEAVSGIFGSLHGCIVDSLVLLNLADNQLSGRLPDQLGQLKNLQTLNLNKNSISGPIPRSLGRLASLVELHIANNRLNGTIPETLGHLSKLERLAIDNNYLEGVVSEAHFTNLERLDKLQASSNSLILRVSSEWIPPFQLNTISLSSWQLGPGFPTWLRRQKNLSSIDLSSTGISDTIPSWFWNLSSRIYYLNLAHNQIHGEIGNLSSFLIIHLGSNCFKGSLPALSPNVAVLDLSNNSFSGPMSRFLCDKIGGHNNLKILDLSKNLLSGEIPDCWGHWQSLIVVKLASNHLTGKIPSSIGSMHLLQSLSLRNNSLSGELPPSLRSCRELKTVDLAENEFTGSIPTWMGKNLPNLIVLSLRTNKFSGDIPSDICLLGSLQILDLAHNNLSGTMPICFNNFTAMATVRNTTESLDYYSYYYSGFSENAFLVIQGREQEFEKILILATGIDLSSNSLSGEIPEQLTSLLGLRYLNLSENLLTGKITQDIGNMRSLQYLDLSINQLSGEIPPSISSLNFLSHFNISYNRLSGRIPSTTQLQTQDASSYMGNQLCGPPFSKNCTTDGGMVPDDSDRAGGDKDRDEFAMEWFYVSMTLGFLVGFWVVWGPLLFNRRWRTEYFQCLERMIEKLCAAIF